MTQTQAKTRALDLVNQAQGYTLASDQRQNLLAEAQVYATLALIPDPISSGLGPL